MNILAIDTSSIVATVCIATEEKILAELSLNHKQNHSETIMPMIDTLLNMVDLDIDDIDYFAITNGPGSFTGLRIGVATIKAMAQATGKKIVSISTLEAMAYNIFDKDRHIVPIIDARAERIFTGIYNNGEAILKDEATTITELLEFLQDNDIQPIFLGDGAKAYKGIIKKYYDDSCFAPISMNMPKASSISSLALEYIKNNKVITYKDLDIEYLRKPQAQRELEERANK